MVSVLNNRVLQVTTVLILLVALFYIEQNNTPDGRVSETIEEVSPTVVQKPLSRFGSDANIEVQDLVKIVYALERYKQDHQSYPVSSSNGQRWDGLLSAYGESREDWIRGLVPDYIEALPRDPRKLSDGRKQYIYKSNGANYKLIVHGATNCEEVKDRYPMLVDPARRCYSYGFWTKRASTW